MARALEHSAEQTQQRTAAKLDWRRKMSDHVAYALLVYTGLQIFMSMAVLEKNNSSILPYFALVALVMAIIPGCRLFEARWSELSDADASNPALAGKFAKDRMAIWAAAIGLPILLTAFFKGVAAVL